MKHGSLLATITLGLTIHLIGASTRPASALSIELAKKCRAMALKAHPYKLPGEQGPGNAAAERQYYEECITHNGKMPEDSANANSSPAENKSTTSPPTPQAQSPVK